jgi:predicted nucleotidyltransferase/Trp operon repressor
MATFFYPKQTELSKFKECLLLLNIMFINIKQYILTMKELNLFPKSTIKIIEILINKEHSVRDLARETKLSPAKITLFVKEFLKLGILLVTPYKNTKIISINKNNILAKQLISTIILQKLLFSNAINELKENSISIGLYGSAAEGTLDKQSDIDLWAITPTNLGILQGGEIKQKLTKELGRETNIKYYTTKNVQELKEKDPIFFNELKYKSKIIWGNDF